MAWGGVHPALAAKTTTPSLPAHTCPVGGRLVIHRAKRHRAARHGIREVGYHALKTQPPTSRDVGEEEPRQTAWGGAHPALAAKTTTPTPPPCACSAGGSSVRNGAKRARAAGQRSRKQLVADLQSHNRRPGAVSLKKSLGQRRWVERARHWQRRQPRQVCQRARVLHGQMAGPPRGEARANRAAHESNAMAVTFRGRCHRRGAVSLKKSLGQRRGMERPVLATQTTTPSLPARACSMGGWPVRLEANRARAARLRSRKLWSRRFEAAAADLARCR